MDKNALYGRPVLALISDANNTLENITKSKKKVVIGVPDKYRETAKKYLQANFKDVNFCVKILKGSVEEGIALGLYNFAIDIVYRGKTIEENNLKIRDIIRASDVSTIASKGVSKRIYK